MNKITEHTRCIIILKSLHKSIGFENINNQINFKVWNANVFYVTFETSIELQNHWIYEECFTAKRDSIT